MTLKVNRIVTFEELGQDKAVQRVIRWSKGWDNFVEKIIYSVFKRSYCKLWSL